MIDWSTLKQRSYVRYSNRQSACVIESAEGHLFPGVRIENASFPLTITEFQAAIFACLSVGEAPKVVHIDEDHPGVPPVWTDTYALTVSRSNSIPKIPAGITAVQKPADIYAYLSEMQSFCKIEESNFPVSCLLQVGSNEFIGGVNIELNDWQLGLCAERVALAKAISMGYRSFLTIHITAAKGDFISPCGACRQVLVEHLPYERMYLYHPDGSRSEHTPADFLPAFFNGNSITE